MASPHGGKRVGAGRPRVADRQLSARISADLADELEAWGEGGGMTAGLRLMSEFSSGVAVELSQGVWMRFHPRAVTGGATLGDAAGMLLESLFRSRGKNINLFVGDKNALTVKARLPLGEGLSAWFFVPARRVASPSPDEFDNDLRRIYECLAELGFVASMAPQETTAVKAA